MCLDNVPYPSNGNRMTTKCCLALYRSIVKMHGVSWNKCWSAHYSFLYNMFVSYDSIILLSW